MVKIRLFNEGEEPGQDVIEDLDMVAVPAVGDTIHLQYAKNEKLSYSVLSRQFHVFVSEGTLDGKYDVVAIEVARIA